MSTVALFPWSFPENKERRKFGIAADPFPGGMFVGPAVDASSLIGIPDVWEIRSKRRGRHRRDPDIFHLYFGAGALAHLWGMNKSKAVQFLEREYEKIGRLTDEAWEIIESTNDPTFAFGLAQRNSFEAFMWLDGAEDTGVYKIRVAKNGGAAPVILGDKAFAKKIILSFRGLRRVQERNFLTNRLWGNSFRSFIRPRLTEWWSYKEERDRQRSVSEWWWVWTPDSPPAPPRRQSVDYRKRKGETPN